MTSPREGVFYFSSLIAYRENTLLTMIVLTRPNSMPMMIYDINKSKGGFDRIHDLSFGGRSRVMQSYTVMKNIMAMTASWSISDSSWGYTRIKKRQMIPRTVILRMLQSRALSGRFCRLQRFRMTVENARMTIRMVM